MSRTQRQPYTGSKAVDKSCRGRGGCPRCASNRTHATTVRKLATDEKLADFYAPILFTRTK